MKKLNLYYALLFVSSSILITGCATKKQFSQGNAIQKVEQTASRVENTELRFVQKVSDNSVYAKNVVGNMTFNIKAGDKDISLPGAIRMRRDEIIRIQLFIPIIGTEVGRLEFTPTQVLFVDRMHKEYIRADYTQLDFLRDNGLTFYSLQALFWNQLLVPGEKTVKEGDLRRFKAAINSGESIPVTLNGGKISYTWLAEFQTGRITDATVQYVHNDEVSVLRWKYSNFKALGVKMFPATQSFNVSSTKIKDGRNLNIEMQMNSVKDDSNWNTETTISQRYKQIQASDLFGKLLNM